PGYQKMVYETYQKMTLEAAEEKPNLIVWPETATPFYFSNDQFNQKKLLQLGKESNSHILFGSPRHTQQGRNVTLFNSAYLISPEKSILGQYDKIHLVPFGEYVPLRKILFFVDKMVAGIGNFGSGMDHTVFSMPDSKFSVLICFEVIFPDLVRRFVKAGAGFLVNITNDAWFGKSAASYQHISMVVFRAVENRRPVIRAANTGITGIIDSRGKIITQTDIFVRDKIIGNIFPEKSYRTFYTLYGDVFAIAVLLCTIVYGGMIIYSKRKEP
ncbi:MAG: apolipoprotein N-acyltransferase, partial [Nitrospinota bacterium]|nr:apolipoprotein N-acyltransferase [Nitrospinota bacterium]